MKATAHFRIIFHMKISFIHMQSWVRLLENYLLFVSIILIEYSLLGYSLCSPSRNVKTKQFSLTKLKAAAVFLPGNSSSDETGSDTPRAPSKSREAILQLAARRQRRPLTSSLGS